jgi:hypothetical protein
MEEENPNPFEEAMRELADKISKIGNFPPISLLPYEGRLDKRSFQTFMKQFNKIGTAYSWSSADCCRHLPLYLKGEAAAIYDALSTTDKSNWNRLVDGVAQALASGDTVYSYRRQLHARKQRETETFAEFASTLTDLVDKAFPDSSGYTANMRRSAVIDCFLDGINIKVREHLRRNQRPATIADAVASAMEEQELQRDLQRERMADTQINWVNTMAGSFRPFFNRPYNTWRGPRRGRGWRGQNRGGWNNFNRPWMNRGNDYRQGNTCQPRGRGDGRPRPTGRGRGRGKYRINNVTVEESSTTASSVASTSFLPFLTIICLLSLFIGFSTADTFHFCSKTKPVESFTIPMPSQYNCSVENLDSIEMSELEAEIFVIRVNPIIVPVFKCSKKTTIACSFSVFKLYTSLDEPKTALSPTSIKDCWELVNKGKLGEIEVMRRGMNTWASNNSLEITYDWLGQQCASTVDYIVEKSIAAASQKNGQMISDLGLNPECRIREGSCSETDGSSVIVWNIPSQMAMCPIVSVGKYPVIISDNYVLVDRFQAAFTFNKDNMTLDPELSLCLPVNSFVMSNNIFIAIPKLKWLPIDPQTKSYISPIHLDIAEVIRNPIKREVKPPGKHPNRHPDSKNPRPPNRINTTITMITFSKEKPPFMNESKETALTTPPRTIAKPTTVTTTYFITTTAAPTTILKEIESTVKPPQIKTTKPTRIQTAVAARPTPVAPTKISTTPTSKITQTTSTTVATFTTTRPITVSSTVVTSSFLPTSNTGTTTKPPATGNVVTEEREKATLIPNLVLFSEKEKLMTQSRREMFMAMLFKNRRSTPRREENNINLIKSHNKLSESVDSKINVKLQYLERQIAKNTRKNFISLWTRICDLHNRQVENIKSFIQIDPSIGVRNWLQRQDIVSEIKGEVIEVSVCHKVKPKAIYWQNSVNGTCYKYTPVLIGTAVFFINPGSRDLVKNAPEIDCSEGKSIANITSVEPPIFPFNYRQVPIVFNASGPHLLSAITALDSLSVLSSFSNRINDVKKVFTEHNIVTNDTSLIEDLVDTIQDIKVNMSVDFDPIGKVTNLVSEYKQLVIYVSYVLLIFIIISALIYFYPWIKPIISKCRPGGSRSGEYRVNNITAPSAPEIELEERAPNILSYIPQSYMCWRLQDHNKMPIFTLDINDMLFTVLLDSGSSISFCSSDVAAYCQKEGAEYNSQSTEARVANGTTMTFSNSVNVDININGLMVAPIPFPLPIKLFISDFKHPVANVVLGSDFIRLCNRMGSRVSIDLVEREIKIGNGK